MKRRLMKTVLAALVVGFVSVGTASAAPITVGQFTWYDPFQIGPSFNLANSSNIPVGSPPPDVTAGDFSDITLSLEVEGDDCSGIKAGDGVSKIDCQFSLGSLTAGTGAFELAAPDPNGPSVVVKSATLTLVFNGFQLNGPWTITASEVDDGIAERFIAVVPEPATLLLLGSGLAMLARRRRR